jgi:parvulin-like peptidyl-prolyl isomerase
MPQPSTRRAQPLHEGKTAPVRSAAASPSRRSISKWDREQRNTRLLVLSGAALACVVVLILAGGWVLDNVIRANDVAATVDGETITTRQLVDEMRPTAQTIETQYRQILGGVRSASAAQAVEARKRQLPDQALSTLVDERILQQEAARRGIAVTAQDVDERLRQEVARFEAGRNPEPTPAAAADAASPTASPEALGTATPVPTLEAAAYEQSLKRLLESSGLTEERYRAMIISRDLLREKLEKAFGADIPANQEQVQARHILLPDEDKAKETLGKLEGGADFVELAKEVSTDSGTKDKGGDLGWFPRGVMNDAFQEAAFGLQPDQRSGVVRSPNGFHIIEVLERDPNRPLDEQQIANLGRNALSKWLLDRRSSPEVKPDLSAAERDWALRQIGVRP